MRIRVFLLVLVVLAAAGVLWITTFRSGRPATGLTAAPDSDRSTHDPLAWILNELERANVGVESVPSPSAAAAWVDANRPESWPYREYETFVLERWSVVLSGAPLGIDEMASEESKGFLAQVAIDADRDGRVSDDELLAFATLSLELTYEQHPFALTLLDSDGDGEVSPDELPSQLDLNRNGMELLAERGRLLKWDADADGRLDEGERAEGERALTASLFMDPSGAVRQTPDGDQTDEDHEAILAEYRRERGDHWADARAAELEDTKRQVLSRELLFSTLLRPIEEVYAHRPDPADVPLPSLEQFFTDGETTLSEAGFEAYQAAWESAQRDRRDQQAVASAITALGVLEYARKNFDADGDGVFSSAELDATRERLTRERDGRILLLYYDTDRDGRIGLEEVADFARWYRSGSMRADANGDRSLDARDLQMVVDEYTR